MHNMIENVNSSLNEKITTDQKSINEYIVFCNLIKEHKHQLRKIASRKPTYSQHVTIYRIIKDVYDTDEHRSFGSDLSEQKVILDHIVSNVVGVDSPEMFHVKTYLILLPFIFIIMYFTCDDSIGIKIMGALGFTFMVTFFIGILIGILKLRIRYYFVKD